MAQPGATGIYAESRRGAERGLRRPVLFTGRSPHRISAARKRSAKSLRGLRVPREFRKLRNGWCNSWWMSAAPASCAPSVPARILFLRRAAGGGARHARGGSSGIRAAVAFRGRRRRTGIFRTGFPAPAAGAPLPATAGALWPGGRKVPQWVFLGHLFSDIVLRDKNALGASGSSTKTSMLHRVLTGFRGGALPAVRHGIHGLVLRKPRARNQVLEAARRHSLRGSQRLELPLPKPCKSWTICGSPGAAHRLRRAGRSVAPAAGFL